MNIAVIGAGAYGCYTIDTILKKFPTAHITLFDVGNKNIKSEEEIGFISNIVNEAYTGLQKGRFFGFGGTTAKWGGQLLFFSKNDFANPSPFLKEIVDLNEKYKDQVLSKFGIKNTNIEKQISEKLFIKTGVWLGYFNRNLFNYFKIAKRKNVKIIPNSRVIKIVKTKENEIGKIVYLQNDSYREATYDFYFLTAGAFESARILLDSGLIKDSSVPFSDHLSQKIFKIFGNTKIGENDFAFITKGSSLITKRIIGEIHEVSFFAHPIFNSEFPFFQNLKRLLFKKEFNLRVLKSIIADMPSVFLFAWYILIKNRIYAYKKEWYLNIDIENPIGKNKISLSKIRDKYNEKSLNVDFEINTRVSTIFENAKELIKEQLIKNKVKFEECTSEIVAEKSEDTYHPFGMLCNYESLNSFYRQYNNMLILNTGILPRAGGINPTAAVFPVIEDYVNNHMK